MVAAVVRLRNELNDYPTVGVLGLDGFSPWLGQSGEYLRRQGMTNSWVVFVPAGDPLYSPFAEPSGTARFQPGYSLVVLTDDHRAAFADLPSPRFAPDGHLVSFTPSTS